jgi:nicotinamide-nucleotide amidase
MEDTEQIDDLSLAEAVAKLLKQKNLKLSVAESLTGGMITSRLVDIPGISENFLEGIVSYSNDSKVKRLGVSEETLLRFGSVSAETAAEMSEGLLIDETNISISTTGIAGPSGDTAGKPVGIVFFGVSSRQNNLIITETFKRIFSGNRQEIREASANFALYSLIEKIKKDFK